jgi:hypothetical protein
VIICGYVNDKDKLSLFFKEFFHPDRVFSSAPEFHAVILCPSEPNEDVRLLISSPILDSRVTYVIGSALSVEDLKKVRGDLAHGMFFLCNTEIGSNISSHEDAATVMRALSVSNFNPDLDCLVQVIRPEDRTILKDSDIDVILCLEEFKTALQARNAVCPGFSTFIENLFHSFGTISDHLEHTMDPWYHEYLHGARMELYYVPLDSDYLHAMNYHYDRLCESLYIQYAIMVVGLCSEDQDDIIFNPTMKEFGDHHKTWKSFFKVYNVALIMAEDQMEAENITRGLTDIHIIETMLNKLHHEERQFPCHGFMNQLSQPSTPPAGEAGGGGGGTGGAGGVSGTSPGSGGPLSPHSDGSNSFSSHLKPKFKLQALNTLRNNLKFVSGGGLGGGGNELGLTELLKREAKEVIEPLSDSDSDDGEHYFGYVQAKEVQPVAVTNARGRKMSSDRMLLSRSLTLSLTLSLSL